MPSRDGVPEAIQQDLGGGGGERVDQRTASGRPARGAARAGRRRTHLRHAYLPRATPSLSLWGDSQAHLCRHRHGRHVGKDDDDQVLHPDPRRKASRNEDDAADLGRGVCVWWWGGVSPTLLVGEGVLSLGTRGPTAS